MDISNPKLLKLKGLLFLVLGLVSSGLLIIHLPSPTVVALLAISIWAFCRFYYFAFYVLHHYADPSFKYSGLYDLACYLIANRRQRHKSKKDS